MALDRKPEGPLPRGIVQHQDYRIGFRNPRQNVPAIQPNEDRFAVPRRLHMIAGLQLYPDDAAFTIAPFIEREDCQVQPVILQEPFDRKSTLQRELLDMIGAQIGQDMLARALLARRVQEVFGQGSLLIAEAGSMHAEGRDGSWHFLPALHLRPWRTYLPVRWTRAGSFFQLYFLRPRSA
jgi:hypothetical protein